MEAYIYTRKSRALGDPDDDPAILSHQREALLRLAERQGITVAPEHIVEEIGSGESLHGRPRLAGLLTAWKQSPPPPGTVLFTASIDRLGRGNEREMEPIITGIREAGVRVVCCDMEYDLTRPTGSLNYAVGAAVSAFNLAQNKEYVRLRKEQLLRDGEPVTGAAPYGYRWNKNREPNARRGRLEVDPGPFAVVQALFHEAVATSIVNLSNRYHLSHSRVRYILRNPVYTGYPAQHCRMRFVEGKRWMQLLPADQWTWPERPGNYPPAVSREQFAAVQEAIDSRFSRYARGKATNGWCRDLLFLRGDRAHASLTSQPWRPGHVPVYRLVAADGAVRFYPRAPIHQAAETAILAVVAQPDLLAKAFALEAEEQTQLARRPGNRLDQQRHRLSAARQQLVGLKLEIASDDEDRLALREAERKLKREIEALKAEVTAAVQRPLPCLPPLAALPVSLEAIGAAWNDQPEDLKRAVANALLSGIHLEIDRSPGRRNATRRILAVNYAPWCARVLECR